MKFSILALNVPSNWHFGSPIMDLLSKTRVGKMWVS